MLELKRIYLLTATHGSLYLDGVFIAFTIELPWLQNKKRISCIAEGCYVLRRRYSVKFKWHYILLDVTDRSGILIHPANNAQQELQGCIAPVTALVGEGTGVASRKAMQKLMEVLEPHRKKDSITLCITSKTLEHGK